MTWKTRIPTISALLIATAAPTAAYADASDPAARIGAYDQAVITIMKAKLGFSARIERFEPVVRAYYDMPTIAALVVGPAWSATPSLDKAAAITALTHHSAVSLARNFASYDGDHFVVDPAVIDRAGSKVVRVTIGGTALYYRMHNAGGSWKIVDAISGGVSQLTLERADLQTTLASGGIPAMVKKLAQLDAAK